MWKHRPTKAQLALTKLIRGKLRRDFCSESEIGKETPLTPLRSGKSQVEGFRRLRSANPVIPTCSKCGFLEVKQRTQTA